MSNLNAKNDSSINVLDLFYYLLSKWKWFLLSLIVFGGLAYLKYAYTPFVYFRQATVIIKDPSNKTSTAGLDRYDNLINKVNVSNEILQFKSKKLMGEVVARLSADVSYQQKKGFRNLELYTQAPVKVSFVDASPNSYMSLYVTLKDAKSVELSNIEGEKDGAKYVVALNDTVKLARGRVVVSPTNFYGESWAGVDIHVQKHSQLAMANYFLSTIGIRQAQDDASILTFSMKDSSPIRAEDVLNTLITIYNENTIQDKNQVAINTANFINERLIIIENELGGVEGEIERFKQDNRIYDIGSAAGQYMGESQKYDAEGLELETQLELARYIKEYLVDPSKEIDLIPTNTGIKDAGVEAQINQYNTMKLRRDKLIADSSEKNPIVEELNNSLRAMKQTIIRSVDNMIVSLDVRRSDAQSRENRAHSRMMQIPTKERKMLSIERQQKIKESLYMFLLNRREENALTQAMADNNARVIDGASGSNAPISPNRNRIILLGILLGLACPTVVFLLILFMDTRVHSRKDVKDVISVPYLGEVPLDKKIMKSGDESFMTSEEDQNRSVAEAMRILRTNMAFMSKNGKPVQVITFTSFNEGAGKTFTARNLAMSYVYAKKRVVMLDLDIRKGTLSRGLLPKHHVGISNYLADHEITIDEIIKKSEDGSTPDIIGAGAIAPNPAELLMDERLDNLIAELRTRYDYIIVDNVPVGIIADATIANRIADITLFVVRAGKLDRRQLPDLETLYQEKKLNNLALVLNGIDVKRWGYGYGYGYGYGHYGRYGYGQGYYGKAKK